jgi:hypothetical protein
MKFIGTPGLTVRISNPKPGEKTHFQFDKDGIFDAKHPFTIKRLTKRGYQRLDEKQDEKSGEFSCKKCDFKTANKGDLLAHYRKEHKKE